MSKNSSNTSKHYNIFREAMLLEEKGIDIIHLEVGDPEIDINKKIIETMCTKAREGHTHYSSPQGLLEFRMEVSSYLNEKFGVIVSPDDILVTPGSKTGLYLTLNFLIKPGSKIVVFEPTWSAYRGLSESLNLIYIPLKTRYEDRWIPNDTLLNKLESLDYDVIILLNPSNPTGKLIPSKIVEEIVEITRKKNAILISDEVYFETLFKGVEDYPAALKYDYEKTISLYSLSKSHAMTGFRLGWITTRNKVWIDKLVRRVQYIYTNVPEFIQYAGVEALRNREIPNLTRRIYRKRVDILAKGLGEAGFQFVYPDGTFYIFAKIHEWISDTDYFISRLLYEKGIAVAPGESFGGYRKFIRFSASASEERLEKAVTKIKEFVEMNKPG